MKPLMKCGALWGALGVALCSPAAGESRRSLLDHEVQLEKELLITAPEVVDSSLASYPGPWSFGYLMEQAFGEEEAGKVTAAWLESWASGVDQDRNGKPLVLPARERLQELVIKPWKRRDGYLDGAAEPWVPGFENAPFRLLAIVNRMDLALPMERFLDPSPRPFGAPFGGAAYYGSDGVDSSGGEGRLVFGVVDEHGKPLEGGTTLIFEYGLDTNITGDRLFDWAMAWHRLGKYGEFDAAYRSELALLTRAFIDRVEDVPSGLGGTADGPRSLHQRLAARVSNRPTSLIRIRTNDGAFGRIREFREFAVRTKALEPVVMGGTPGKVFFEKGTRENRWLARWLRDQRGKDVVPGTVREDAGADVPAAFALPVTARLGGVNIPVLARVAPVVDNDKDYHWDSHGLNDAPMRRAFSMQTCCGCHCGDTETAFFHIAPREAGQEAKLSRYLRTDGSRWRVKDPGNRRSHASSEMDDRKAIFEGILSPDLSYRALKSIRARRNGRGH